MNSFGEFISDLFGNPAGEVSESELFDESEENAGWADMVNRLKAGEDVPGVALAPNGNVIFLVLD